MKTLLLSTIAILFASSAFASTIFDEPTPIPVLSNTTKELSHLLNKSRTEEVLEKEELANITFTINNLHQIVVLQVNSDNYDVQDFVKHALNYKKLSSNELIVGKYYVFEATFKD